MILGLGLADKQLEQEQQQFADLIEKVMRNDAMSTAEKAAEIRKLRAEADKNRNVRAAAAALVPYSECLLSTGVYCSNLQLIADSDCQVPV